MPEPTEFKNGETLGLLRAAWALLYSSDSTSRLALARTIGEFLKQFDPPEQSS